jgi:signal peptidase
MQLKRDKLVLYCFSVVYLLLVISLLFFPANNYKKIIVAIVSLIAAIFAFLEIKKRLIYSINKGEVLFLMALSGVLYVMLYYMSGLHFGFYNFGNKLNTSVIFLEILPLIVTIVSVEITRTILLAGNSKVINVIAFVLGVISQVLVVNTIITFTTFNDFMSLVGLTVIPAISDNLLNQYLAKRYGAKPNVAYKLIITLYVYLFSVFPAVEDSLFAFYKVLVPLLIMTFIRVLYEKERKFRPVKSKVASSLVSIVLVVIVLFVAMVISGQFSIGTIIIGSGSMSGELETGDMLVYEKYDTQDVSVGQIIVFEKDKQLVIHRVVEIENVDNTLRYYTKGDANDSIDKGFITKSQIIGVSLFKIPLIGYPSIWIQSLFKT